LFERSSPHVEVGWLDEERLGRADLVDDKTFQAAEA
jgi:hypothetical protein